MLVDVEFFSSFYWWMKLLVKKKSLKIASQKCLPSIDVEFLCEVQNPQFNLFIGTLI